MKRYILVVGGSTAAQQNSITNAVKAASNSWWHHLPTVWLIIDHLDRTSDKWRALITAAVPGVTFLVLDADGLQVPYGVLPKASHDWLYTSWRVALPAGDLR